MAPNHLVIVCGHAIWLGGRKNGWEEAEWLIEGYKQGETPTFIEHIKAGVQVLSEDESAVLAFSGGPTRKETPLSEARSYFNLAVANLFFGLLPSSITGDTLLSSGRILLEERALDSYYNILFSLTLFWHTHHTWPQHLTIVSHDFKRTRLVDGHCAAIGFPLDKISYIGINPPGIDSIGLGGQGEKGEVMKKGVQLTLGLWKEDPHGVGEELAGKRRARNCWGVHQRLFETEEERVRSGVEVRVLGDGSEALVEGGRRPWAG